MRKQQLISILSLLFFLACSQVPDGVLDRKKMETVLYDVHIIEGVMEEYPAQYRTEEAKQKLMVGVFHKNHITKAEFDSSMVYYGAHLDQYMKIYQTVTARLNAQRDLYAEELSAYEKSLLTPKGDSVDLWRKPKEFVLDPALLTYTHVLEIKGDSNFNADDRLVWKMRFNQMPPDSLAYVYVAFGYAKGADKTEQVTGFVAENGWFSLEMEAPLLTSSDRVFATATLINRLDTLLQPVYIDSISLMRYHPIQKSLVNDSIRTDSVAVDSLNALPVDTMNKN
ncbi:MAG: DUF4296 domain-containing protein [Bacteroidales bacterium]